MIILGIDPGVGRLGWGIVQVDGSRFKPQNFGCIETDKGLLEKRIQTVYEEVSKLIKEYQPDVVSIEDLFFTNNAKTAFMVGQARGVVLLAASQAGLPISVYTPQQVKLAVTGYGKADKKQVGEMVKVLLKLKTVPKLDDTADALAIALTHAFSYKLKASILK
jgi:crossover junction endodeoxyribonuclease RuvC